VSEKYRRSFHPYTHPGGMMSIENAPPVLEALEPRALFNASAPISLAAAAVPRPDHVIVVVEENKGYSQIVGSSQAPYLNSLATGGALFTNFRGITHPSQPNYIALFSGSTQGVTDNSTPHTFSAPNLGGELLAAGLSFTGYSESLPYAGFTGASSGAYWRKHNPWVNFTDVPASSNQPFTAFPADFSQLPALSFVIPNQLHDMHDGTIRQADDWLRANLGGYVQWAQTHNSLLIVTFDEDNGLESNRIPTLFVGPMVRPGKYAEAVNHYNTLRTLEDMYGLPYAGRSATAAPITDVWTTSPPPPPPPSTRTVRVTPTADAEVRDGSYSNLNFGTLRTMGAKTTATSGFNRDAYLKFDTASLGTVSTARLRFYGALSGAGRVSTSVYSVASTTWTETGIKWSTRPARGRLLGTVSVASTTYGWYEVDVTSQVKAAKAANQRFVSFALHNPLTSPLILNVNSREATANRPVLVLSGT
jgi:hypothetical protein